MIKSKFIALLVLLVIISIFGAGRKVMAQVKVEFSNPELLYENVTKSGVQKLPDTQKLLNYKSQPLPVSFADTLKKYYWFELCSYHYTESLYSTYFGQQLEYNSVQLNFIEYDKEGRLIRFQLMKTPQEYAVYTTTFDKSTATKLVEVKNINKLNYLVQESYGEKEYLHLVCYTNGILVYDISISGKVGAKANFRIALLGVEKK